MLGFPGAFRLNATVPLSVRVAALNLRWLLILGLTRRDEAWVLA